MAGRDVPIRAVHFTEMRGRIGGLWTAAGMGSVPEFSGGGVTSGTRTVKDSDLLDLRRWLSQYEEGGFGEQHRARACYLYDSYDGTSQFGRGRRRELGPS